MAIKPFIRGLGRIATEIIVVPFAEQIRKATKARIASAKAKHAKDAPRAPTRPAKPGK